MTEPFSSPGRPMPEPGGHVPGGGLAALAMVVAMAVTVVLARVGAPLPVLTQAVVGLLLAGAALFGLLSGAMRLRLFLTAGRAIPGGGLGLSLLAVLVGLSPSVPLMPAAIGLAAGAIIVAPALRRSGAVSLPGWLASRHPSRTVRLVAAALAAAVAAAVALDGMAHLLSVLSAAGITATPALIVAGLAVAFVGVPGGLRGVAGTTVILGTAVLLILVAVIATGSAGEGASVAAAMRLGGGDRVEAVLFGVAVAAGTALAPPLMALTAATPGPRSARAGWFWGAAFLALAALASSGKAWTGDFAALEMAVLRAAGGLAQASLGCTAMALLLSVDLAGRPRLGGLSTSARFMFIRLSVGAAVLAALACAVRQWGLGFTGPALALSAAAFGPALLLGWARPAIRPAAIVSAMSAGAATVLVAVGGHLGALASGLGVAAALGVAVGAALGLAVGLIPGGPAARPLAPLTDDAL